MHVVIARDYRPKIVCFMLACKPRHGTRRGCDFVSALRNESFPSLLVHLPYQSLIFAVRDDQVGSVANYGVTFLLFLSLTMVHRANVKHNDD